MQAAENGFDTWAPPAAAIVRDFVNSYEPQEDAETFVSPVALRDWFAVRDLVPESARFTTGDVDSATDFREGLRTLLMAHADGTADDAARHRLDGLLERFPLQATVNSEGVFAISGSGTEFEQAVAGVIDAILRCQAAGDWDRLKVCARDTCRWAFYDASRNHGRRWCSMSGCGNYTKMRRRAGARTQ